MKKRKVYIVSETYKDNDPEDIGCYDSEAAAVRGLARWIASEVWHNLNKDELKKPHVVAGAVAEALATVIPGFLGEDWALDEDGCCSYGRSHYGWREMEVESIDKNLSERMRRFSETCKASSGGLQTFKEVANG